MEATVQVRQRGVFTFRGSSLPCRLLIALAVTPCAGATLVFAFAEEPLTFRDPAIGQLFDEEISTIHDNLTYVLALAAGFSMTDRVTLQVWNQLTDSEALGPGDAISYTNGGGAFPPAPNLDGVCRGKVHSTVIWPQWADVTISWQAEGRYFPLGLDTPLAGMAGSPTLGDALYAFVHTWDFDAPTERRAYADQMAAAILTLRQPRQRMFLPLTLK